MSNPLALPSQLANLSSVDKKELVNYLQIIITASADNPTAQDQRARDYLTQIINALQAIGGPL